MEFASKTHKKRNDKKVAPSKSLKKTECSERYYPVQRFGAYINDSNEHLKKDTDPIQRVIQIGGRNYCNFNDLDSDADFIEAFKSVFGDKKIRSSGYLTSEKMGDNLDFYLWSDTIYPFWDFQQLFYTCLPELRGYLQYTPAVIYKGMAPVEIYMTGSRQKDYDAANDKCGLRETPKKYTWHHIEGIYSEGENIKCKMILLESSYHKIWHVGSVNQYEILKNVDYG